MARVMEVVNTQFLVDHARHKLPRPHERPSIDHALISLRLFYTADERTLRRCSIVWEDKGKNFFPRMVNDQILDALYSSYISRVIHLDRFIKGSEAAHLTRLTLPEIKAFGVYELTKQITLQIPRKPLILWEMHEFIKSFLSIVSGF